MHSRYAYKRTMSISFSCVRKSNMFCSFEREKKGHFKWNLNNQQVYFEYQKRKKHTNREHLCESEWANCVHWPKAIIIIRSLSSWFLSIDTQSRTWGIQCAWLSIFIHSSFGAWARVYVLYSTYIRCGCFDFFWDCGMTPSKYTWTHNLFHRLCTNQTLHSILTYFFLSSPLFTLIRLDI